MECEITGSKRSLVTTEDGKYINFDIYKNSSNYYKKGCITLKEVKDYIEDIDNYKSKIEEVVRRIKRCSIKTKKSEAFTLKLFIDSEKRYCEDVLKKDYKTITIADHIEVINYILANSYSDNIDDIEVSKNRGKAIDSVERYYMAGRETLNYL